MTRALRLVALTLLLSIGGTACSMIDRESDAAPARVAGSGSSVYAPGSTWEALPDPYHYRCTGACLSF